MPARRRVATYQFEFAAYLRALDPVVKGYGKDLAAQKFAFVALNNY
jgi:hypothetical protein